MTVLHALPDALLPRPTRELARVRRQWLGASAAAAFVLLGAATHLSVTWLRQHDEAQATAQQLAQALRWPEADDPARAAVIQKQIDEAPFPHDPLLAWGQVADGAGAVLAHRGTVSSSWAASAEAPVAGPDGTPVAQVRVMKSLAPLLPQALLDLALMLAGALALALAWRRLGVAKRALMAQHLSRAREESANVFKVLFDRSDDALLICEHNGHILAANPAAERIFEISTETLLQANVEGLLAHGRVGVADEGFALRSGEVAALRHGSAQPFAAAVEVHQTHQDGQSRYIVSVRDLTDHRQTQERLQYLANFDSLTGLPNRALFRDRLAQAMERARRTDTPMALMFLDLDRFKVINDSLGHEVGDRLLRHVADTLAQSLRTVDSVSRVPMGSELSPYTVSRLGGDEFTVIAEGVAGAEDAAMIARRLLDALSVPLQVGDEEIQVSASIGISMYPMDDVDLDGMVRHTDMAMYRSKSLGRNTYSFFSDDLNAAVSSRLSLEGHLRRALDRKEFLLHFQPKALLTDGRITGVEALLRWHSPGRGMVPPDRFITVLEDTGLIVSVGAWVIRAACQQVAEWDRAGLPPVSLAVNLSARQLRHPYLVSLVEDTLRETGIHPSRLELELTESLLMEDTEVNRNVLKAFSRLGVQLAIDDFGTGHSSLSYLRRLDVDTLKIDRSFVTQLPHDPEDCAIATAIIALGHSLSMKVVAEGVETQEQADFLRNLGCTEVQGWLLSRALPAGAMAEWLARKEADYRERHEPRRFGAAAVMEAPLEVIRLDG